ncbi:MAG TPA: DUF4214 domain-containing protein [Pyrinomonadaceae bacterium]|jgi:hypothetical protein
MGILRLAVSPSRGASRLSDSLARFSVLTALALCAFALAPRVASAATLNVASGGDLQAALNAAQPGDTIVIQAGASFAGPVTLPNKNTASAEWITVRTSTPDSALAAATGRVSPADSPLLAKIISPGTGEAALQTAPGAHHWRLIGLEFRTAVPWAQVYDLVKLGASDSAQDTSEEVPHHFLLDRCLVTAFPTQTLKRGVALQSAETTITGCYIAGFKSEFQDAQAIAGWNGPGPYHIVNNYLEASGENLIFGGATPAVAGLIPTDIEIRRNHFFKPLSWRQGDPSYAGTRWSVKNLLELKSARRVVIEGNVFENNWNDVNWGYGALNLTVRGDSGSWATLEDVTITNNVIKHVGFAVNVVGKDTYQPSGRGRGLRIVNNLFFDVNGARWSEDGVFVKITDMPDVTVEHNTVLHTGSDVQVYGAPSENFVFANNLMAHNSYGIIGTGVSSGRATITQYFPGSTFRRNVISGRGGGEGYPNYYPADNFYPASLDDAGFTNPAGEDYSLSPSSPYRNQATDGKDIGCDFAAIAAAMRPPAPAPTPTPTPVATPTPAPPPPAATPTPTPTPAPEGRAKLTVLSARRAAQDLSNDLAGTTAGTTAGTAGATAGPTAAAVVLNPADRVAAVVAAIQQAYVDFGAERTLYPAAARIEASLSSALGHAAAANTYATQGQLAEAKAALQKAIDCLELADVLMVYGNVENPVDYAEYFVRQHYVDFLGREPDESGRAYWTNKIKSCGADARCVEGMRIDVSAAYFRSIEFQQTGYVVYRLYRGSLGRTVLFNEFIADTQEVEKGVIVGETGWQERLAANKKAFYQAWVQRADFRSRYDQLTDARFVDALYASMGVAPPAAERDALVASLQSGATRADVLARLVENEEFSKLETNKAFVLMQYFGYLRRNPDQAGYQFWLSKLEQFGGDFRAAEMVKAFLSSTEYRDRFRQQ